MRPVVVAFLLAGCATWPFARPAAPLLAQADALAAEGHFAEALRAYDDVLARYPHDREATSIAARRDTVQAVVAAQSEIDRLKGELAAREAQLAAARAEVAEAESQRERLAHDLASRDTELSRARREVVARQAEATRLAAEAEQLRSDLEDLKRIEMRIERRRR